MKPQSSKVLGFPSSRGGRGGRGAGPQQGMTRGQASSARGGRGAGPQAAMGRGAAPATGPMAQMAAMAMGRGGPAGPHPGMPPGIVNKLFLWTYSFL